MLITLNNGVAEQYDDEPFAQGGQGTLHLSRDKRWVVKLYHQADEQSNRMRAAALSPVASVELIERVLNDLR